MTLCRDNEQVLRHIRWRSTAHFLGEGSHFPRLVWGFIIAIMILVAVQSRNVEPKTWIPAFLWFHAAVSCVVWVAATMQGSWALSWVGYYTAWIALSGIVISSPATFSLGYVLMLVGLALSALDMPSRPGFMALSLWAASILMAVEGRELNEVLPSNAASIAILIFVLVSVLLLQSLSLLESIYRRGFCDDLTGVGSRRMLGWLSKTALTEANRRGQRLSLLLLDLDNFKRVNDHGGHALGDAVLEKFAKFIHGEIRSEDILCRYGGDEFAILLRNTDHKNAVAAAQRLRKRVADVFSQELSECPISISVGVATYPEHGASLTELLNKADRALMAGAKLQGRNRVATAEAFHCGDPWDVLRDVLSPSMVRLMEILGQIDEESIASMARMVELAGALGTAMGLSEDMQAVLMQAAALHDVGKIAVPKDILNKAEPLSLKEQQAVMQHAEIGAAILANLDVDEDVIKAIRHLHEWWDGEGYPDGLRGEEIPTAAAILAVADAYDTLTRPGPHGEARTPTEAVQEILRRSGQQFSPHVAAKLPKVLERAS